MACKHINKVTSFKGLPNIKKRYLLFLWELPQLLLAFSFYVILKPRIAYRLRYMDAKIYLIKNFPGGISLSYIIFLNDQNTGNNNSIKHEYGHSMQSLRLGWMYIFVVGIPSLIRAIIWNKRKLDDRRYYEGYPENWAEKLGGLK